MVLSCDVIQSKFEGVDIQLTGFGSGESVKSWKPHNGLRFNGEPYQELCAVYCLFFAGLRTKQP